MKVAIVCGAISSEMLAPFNDKSWEIWVLGNRLNRYLNKRVTRVFEIHDDLSEHEDPKKYVNYLIDNQTKHKFTLTVGNKFPYDLIDEKKEKICIDHFLYDEAKQLSQYCTLASSPAYMMASAILEGAKEIALYGVDMAVDDHEYFWQRPCMWGWVRFAEGKGIKVHIPKESALMAMDYEEGRDWKGGFKGKARSQFAIEPFTERGFMEMAEMHNKKVQELSNEIKQKENIIRVHAGHIENYTRLAKIARAVESGQKNLTLASCATIKD